MDQSKEEVKMQSELVVDKQRTDLNLLSMIESRIMEVIQIEDECKKKMPKLFKQRLPRFMRRRAASHNPKRLPKRLRPKPGSIHPTKSRKSLLKYRHRTKFQKFKRIIKKHSRHRYEDPTKCLLHNWFSKRFKLTQKDGQLSHIPMYNNTKNERNLYRQSRYGCAYISLIHLSPLELTLAEESNYSVYSAQLSQINQLTNHVTGFTFNAKALEKGRYEVGVHLYAPKSNLKEHICTALVSYQKPTKESKLPRFTLWIPRAKYQEVQEHLQNLSDQMEQGFSIRGIFPRDWVRIKLLGPSCHDEAARIIKNKKNLNAMNEDIEKRLGASFGTSLGRLVNEKFATLTYYNTKPKSVDIVFKTSEGRLLWHKLIKNKAHLVGGYKDLDRLLLDDSFRLIPDI